MEEDLVGMPVCLPCAVLEHQSNVVTNSHKFSLVVYRRDILFAVLSCQVRNHVGWSVAPMLGGHVAPTLNQKINQCHLQSQQRVL